MELTLEQTMAIKMQLCALLLETFEARMLSPPRMQGEEEEGL
jgi:hypothetical protein